MRTPPGRIQNLRTSIGDKTPSTALTTPSRNHKVAVRRHCSRRRRKRPASRDCQWSTAPMTLTETAQ